MPVGELGEAFRQTYRSPEAAERFISEHPQERDLCAGVLLNIAGRHLRKDRKKALEVYQKAITDYGIEVVPDKNCNITVADYALFRIGILKKEMGQREEALAIFGKLSESADFNTRRGARNAYLMTRQSGLKLKATVSVPKRTFARGQDIPVSVTVRNPGNEDVTFQCFVQIRRSRHKSYGAIGSLAAGKEITLKPGEEFIGSFSFTGRDRLEPESWLIDCSLNGVRCDSNSTIIKVTG